MTADGQALSAAGFTAPALWGPVPPPPHGQSWEVLMERALDLACRAGGLSCASVDKDVVVSGVRPAPLPGVRPALGDEVPVGALVVTPDGEIVGEAANAPVALHDPTAHAEVLALRAAGQRLGNYRLSGCVLVVTLEPCLMCVGAIAHARIAGVVYGAGDARAGAVASALHGFDLALHVHRPWHMGGVCADACAAVLRDFFVARRTGTHERPLSLYGEGDGRSMEESKQ